MDFGKLENIIFVASASAAALFFLIITFVIIGKGKRKRNAADVVLCIFAVLVFLLCAFMTVCSVYTGMTGNIRIDTTVDPVLFYHGGKVTELPLAEFFVLLSDELVRDIVIGVMVLAFITFGCDCIIANKKEKKEKKNKKAKADKKEKKDGSSAKKHTSPEEIKRAAELERIKRLGDAAVKKASGAAETAKAPTAQTASAARTGDVVRTAKREEEEEPDWLKAADAHIASDQSGFVGLSHIDDKSDFDTFDDTDAQPAPDETPDEKAWYEDDEPVPAFITRTKKEESGSQPSEPASDSAVGENGFEDIRESADGGEDVDDDPFVSPSAEESGESADFAADGNGIIDGDDVKPDDDVDADGAWYAQDGDDGIVDGDDLTDDAAHSFGESEEEYDLPPTDEEVDSDGAWYAQSGDGYADETQIGDDADTYNVADTNDDGESDDESSYEIADRDGYIPKIRTIERAQKPASDRAVRQTARVSAAKSAPSAAKKNVSSGGSKAEPTRGNKSSKPTQKAAKKGGKANGARTDAKKLPVTRRYVILDKTSAVNIFSDYLKERDKAEKDKLTSSINTIIIK